MKHKKILTILSLTAILTITAGAVLNSTVRALNRGMPIIGYPAFGKYVPISEGTKFVFLADVIRIGDYVLSIGDLFFFTGILTCLVALWLALPQGRKFFPLVIINLIGIFWSIAQPNHLPSTILCEMAAVVSILAMYWSYRSNIREQAVIKK